LGLFTSCSSKIRSEVLKVLAGLPYSHEDVNDNIRSLRFFWLPMLSFVKGGRHLKIHRTLSYMITNLQSAKHLSYILAVRAPTKRFPRKSRCKDSPHAHLHESNLRIPASRVSTKREPFLHKPGCQDDGSPQRLDLHAYAGWAVSHISKKNVPSSLPTSRNLVSLGACLHYCCTSVRYQNFVRTRGAVYSNSSSDFRLRSVVPSTAGTLY
jgi:hypothetical protein